MDFHYRNANGSGPFRVNISNFGVGYSMGGRGFRAGVSSRGRRNTTFGIPGIGVSYFYIFPIVDAGRLKPQPFGAEKINKEPLQEIDAAGPPRRP